jgi:Zn-dependent peptidase ImmA (M78 family)
MINDFTLKENIDYKKIKTKVNELLIIDRNELPPIDVFYITEQIGIKLMFVKLYNGGLSYMYLNEGIDKTLLIDSDVSYYDKRFLAAHNIGHYMLHSKNNADFMDGKAIFNINLNNIMEYEANVFALSLLIPEEKFDIEYNQLKEKSVSDILIDSYLSTRFAVNSSVLDYKRFDKSINSTDLCV